MRPLKIILITLIGLACGVGLILAYHKVTSHTLSDLLDAPTSGRSFSDAVAAPDRLIIPKLSIDAHVKAVGVDAKGDMATPGNPTDVAWYQYGPHPGMTGSAVIDGHLDTKYVPQAVFYHLGELAPGDEVQVRTVDGQTLTFKVTEVRSYAYDAPTDSIFKQQDSGSHLNLITCAGDWDPDKKIYKERAVVFTERVS